MKLTSALLAVLLLSACAGDNDGPRTGQVEMEPPPMLSPAPPLPECPDFDYSPCDIRDGECQSKLLALAACVRQSEVPEGVSIELLTPEQLAEEIRLELAEEMDPAVDHFEIALQGLGLTTPTSFTLDERIATFVELVAGLFQGDRNRIVVVDKGAPADGPIANGTLLHEMIHALQHHDYDLVTWPPDVELPTFDADLASRAVVEGEATFYELRVAAPMLGLDIDDVDFDDLLEDQLRLRLHPVLTSTTPFDVSFLTFPYAFGAHQAYRAWQEGGPVAISEYFTSVPLTTQGLLSRHYQLDEPQNVGVEILQPTTALSLDSQDCLGAWGLLLLLGPETLNLEAVQHALSWRGDQLWVYTDADGEDTWALWQLELSTKEEAQFFDAVLAELPDLEHETFGKRVYASFGNTSSSTELVEWGKSWVGESE